MVSPHHPYRTLFVSCTASTHTLTSYPSALPLALEITRECGDLSIAQDNYQPYLLLTWGSEATTYGPWRDTSPPRPTQVVTAVIPYDSPGGGAIPLCNSVMTVWVLGSFQHDPGAPLKQGHRYDPKELL